MYERLLNKASEPTREEMAACCGDGGWLHYRVTGREQYDDILKLLEVKCAP